MRIHIFAIIKYILVVALIVLFILVFKQNYLVFLLFPYVLLLMISIPVFLSNVKNLSFKCGSDEAEVDLDSTIHFYVEYSNPSFFPFLKSALSFNVHNMFLNSPQKKSLNFSIRRKRTERVYVSVLAGRTGMVEFETGILEVSDYLGILTKKLDFSSSCRVPVFPSGSAKLDVPEIPYYEGYDEYSEPDMKGNISSDTKEIREYRPGDRLTRIHWKISSKLDELMVKEPDRTSVMSVVMLPEFERTGIFKTIDTLDAAAKSFMEKGERFEICLFNEKLCSFEFFVINDAETLTECYREMYFLPLYDRPDAAKEAYYASAQKESMLLSIHEDNMKLFDDGLEIVSGTDNLIV